MSSRTSISLIPYNPYPQTMYNFPPNLVLEPSSLQRGHPTQSDEDISSDIKKTKEEIFALAKKLVAQGPKSMKVAVIIQFKENQEFQEYGSPDVRSVVDEYLRLPSKRIIPEPRVRLTGKIPELEKTAPYPHRLKKRRYESINSPASAEQHPELHVGISIPSPIAWMSLSNGVIPEDPEEEPRAPPRKLRHKPPTWPLAELPSRNSFSNADTNLFPTSLGEFVAPWRDSGNQPGLAGSSKIIEEGVHNNRDRVSSLDDTSQSDSFLQNFQPSPPKPGQFDTANVHEHPTSKAVFDHTAESRHGLLGNTASLLKGITASEEEIILPEHQC